MNRRDLLRRAAIAAPGLAGCVTPPEAGREVLVDGQHASLYALDSSTGEERWRHRPEGAIESSPTVAYDTVYVGSEDGSVYAIGR